MPMSSYLNNHSVKLYYWNEKKNFDDFLSPYLITKITNLKVQHVDSHYYGKLVAIGSLLRYQTLFTKSHIWGTGSLTRDFQHKIPIFNIKRQIHNLYRSYCCKSTIHALRGPLSADICLKAGFEVPQIYADPAVLLPSFYKPKMKDQNKKVGLVLHHSQMNLISNNWLDRFRFIDIARQSSEEIEDFIDEIVSCDFVFSSSLHGIVVAQAYGIPAQWITIRNIPIHKDETFKFHDYFLGVNQIVQEPLCIDISTNELQKYSLSIIPPKIRMAEFDHARQRLLDSFPDVSMISI